MRDLFTFAVALGLLLPALTIVSPVQAQWQNLETVQGSGGKTTTLTQQPRRLADGLSARALGIAVNDTTRWALSLIGVDENDSIRLRYGGETLPILRIERPTDGPGPTTIYVSKETFLTIAETQTVKIKLGGTTASFPSKLRREMGEIIRRVS